MFAKTVFGALAACGLLTAAQSADTDWMVGKVGAFAHYLPDAKSYPRVDDFDVKGLVAQLKAMRADFFVITLGQNTGYYCSPNPTLEALGGFAPHARCSRRDVPAEIIAALKGSGIRFGLYLPCQPATRDDRMETNIGFPKDVDARGGDADRKFTDKGTANWAKCVEAWARRYGRDVSFWWFDGAYAWLGFNGEIAARYRAACRAGNPDVAIAFNAGDRCQGAEKWSDVWAGEESARVLSVVPASRWAAPNLQWQVLTFLGKTWGEPSCRFADEPWRDWLAAVTAKGGCVTFDLHIDLATGRLEPAQADQFRRIRGDRAAPRGVTFAIDATRPGRALPNVEQTLVTWNLQNATYRGRVRNAEHDPFAFAEYVEVMGATGGNPERDCYRAPADRSRLDDYDFSRLVNGCRDILALGCKPYLKLGNVPQKLSSDVSGGDFRMNIRPPDDYAAYGRYMRACADTLLAAFGRDELLTWRFALLTEFENPGWFADVTKNPEKTFNAYCRLYETTVEHFVNAISPDLVIGAHAMTVTEGLWDERRFFKFVAEKKLPLKFATTSFYDRRPGEFTSGLPLEKCIAHLRDAAEAAGLTNLFYAVDEGRLLWGKTRDKPNDDLGLRIVGDTYQAAYDARLIRQLFAARAEYFAAWGYLSGPATQFEGVPSVSFHVAREAAKFKGLRELKVVPSGVAPAGVENGAVAARATDGSSLLVMAYSFTNDLFATGRSDVELRVKLPQNLRGRTLRLTTRLVDDDANWFDEWRADRKRLGIGDGMFRWSPDDPAPLQGFGLTDAKVRARFTAELEPKYRACSRLKAVVTTTRANDAGELVIRRPLSYGGVLFVEVGGEGDEARLADWTGALPARFKSGAAVPALESAGPRSALVRGDWRRFERVWAHAARGETIRVAVIGGSITQGAGASRADRRWGERLAANWQRAFPKAKIEFVNAGIGATGSDIGAFRVARDVLAKQPDVVAVEFSVNDAPSAERAASYEGLLRQLLRAPQGIAVIALGMVNQAGGNAQACHAPVAAHYGVPYVSYRDGLYFPFVKNGFVKWTDISPDTIHPNDDGHAFAAALVGWTLARHERDWRAAGRPAPSLPPLPAPRYGTRYDHGEFLLIRDAKIVANNGFFPLRDLCWGEGLACTNANGRLAFEVEGKTVALLYRCGNEPYNWGKIAVKIDGRVVTPRLDCYRDQWWWYTPSLFLCADTPGRHVVEVETLAEKNAASKGYGCHLTGLLVGR